MATLTAQEAAALGTLLQKVMGGNGYTGKGTQKNRSDAFDKYNKSNDGSDDQISFDRLKLIVKNNGSLAEQLGATLKDISSKGKVISGLFKDLEEATRAQSNVQRKAAQNMADMIEKSKNAVAKLEQVTRILNKAETRLQSSESTFAEINKLMNARSKLKGTITRRRNQGKPTESYEKELEQFEKDNTKKLKDLNLEAVKNINSFKLLNKITGTLSKEQVKLLERFPKMTQKQREQSGIYDVLKDSIASLNGSTKMAADHIEKNSKIAGDSFAKAGRFALAFGKALLTMIPGLYSGMTAKQKFNVNESGYIESGFRGMSEPDRAETIGTNRIGLRALGNGNAETGFTNAKVLQDTAHIFGVTGKEALEKALSYQQTSMGMGIKASDVKGQQLQMSFMHDFSKQIGATDDELQSFYGSLSDMGEMAALNQQFSDKTESERSKAINDEISQRLKLNRSMGVSIEQQKQMQQATMNQRYSGIANIIRSQIMGSMFASTVNKTAPGLFNKSDSDFFTTSVGAVGIDGQLSNAEDQKRFEALRQKSADMLSGKFKKAQDDQASGKDRNALLNLNAQFAPLMEGIHMNIGDFATKYSTHSLQGKTQGSTAISAGSFDEMITQAAKHMDGPDGFNQLLMRANEILGGFNKSPIGGSGGVAAFLGAAIGQAIGGKLLKFGAGQLVKRMGGTAVESLAGTSIRSVAGAGIGSLAGGGIAGIATIVVGVLGAAVVGAAIGTLFNKMTEGTKVGDAVGSGVAQTLSHFGNDTATMAIAQNNYAATTMAAGDARRNNLNAVTSAQQEAMKAKGTPMELQAFQRAESLRENYKKSYGVDLTGHGIGYSAPTSVANRSLSSNMKINDNDESRQQADDRKADENFKLQEITAKNTGDLVALTKKSVDKDQQADEAAKAGNVYKYYADHLSKMQTGIA